MDKVEEGAEDLIGGRELHDDDPRDIKRGGVLIPDNTVEGTVVVVNPIKSAKFSRSPNFFTFPFPFPLPLSLPVPVPAPTPFPIPFPIPFFFVLSLTKAPSSSNSVDAAVGVGVGVDVVTGGRCRKDRRIDIARKPCCGRDRPIDFRLAGIFREISGVLESVNGFSRVRVDD